LPPDPSQARSREAGADSLLSLRYLGEKAIELVIKLCGVSAILFVFGIFYFVLREGFDFLTHRLDWIEFFTSNEWRPTSRQHPTFGALTLISGSVAVTFLSMAMAVPFGIGTAVFLSEFCSTRVKETLKIVIELLAAIPSVVWGFIGITLMNQVVIALTGAPVGVNVLNASIILALMSVPIIVSIGEDALKAVPDTYREAAEALGATRWQVVYKVLFPAAKNGILAAVLLGVGRAVGETMAVLMATGHSIQSVFDGTPPFSHALRPTRTLTATIAAEMGEAPQGGDHYQALFVIGLLLFFITFVINLTADLAVRGIRKE
jgi:phosphate transport system permease protein